MESKVSPVQNYWASFKEKEVLNGVSAIILAGGKNTRMQGEDKAFLEIEGKPIIARIIEKLKPLVRQIIVVTNSPEKYINFDLKIVKDEHPGKGPLMGIYSGLRASSCKYNFVVACDMPFINETLMKHMLANIDAYDILIPRIDKVPSGSFCQIGLHPLFGIYSKVCIPAIEEMLEQEELRISSLFSRVKTRFIVNQELEKFAGGFLSLLNINTQQELKNTISLKINHSNYS